VGRDSEDVGSAGVLEKPSQGSLPAPVLGARLLSPLGGGHRSHTPGTGIRKTVPGIR
jgi:hypothetical protein